MKFGEILSKIESKMVSSYVNETVKKELVNFKKIVLEDKSISGLVHLYTEIIKNHGFQKETADLYITESIRQIEKLLSTANLQKVNEWTKDVVCENVYSNVDNLVYVKPTNILETVESRKVILNNLIEKPKVQESINLPIESIFKIAGKQLENYIENLDESSKTDLAKVLMTEDTQLSEEFSELKTKTIEALKNISSVDDDTTKNKLQETIDQIKQDEYSKINYVRLFSLYNNIQ
jgi:hypothetical protein